MICHIVQNGGYMFLIVCLCIIATNTTVQNYSVQEFCSGNLFIHNIEPGELYVLTLRNEQSSAHGVDKWYHKSKRKCQQEFRTSDSAAHFEISISNMTIPSCRNCRCSYFEISTIGHRKRFCGHEDHLFSSKTDTLSIDFHPGLTMTFDVTFTFTVKRNFYVITGTSKGASFPISFIETPYFPISHPPNYRVEYILQSSNVNAHVMLMFLDFQISHQSFIEVTGNNGSHATRFYGSVFRPPVIVSQLNSLALKFVSNDQLGMFGFRAELSSIKSVDPLFVPYTDCSGPKDGRDGYIQITHEGFGFYDCVWRIMSLFLFPTKLYRSVSIQLRYIGYKSNLEFRNGSNSKSGIIVKNIDCGNENCTNLDTEIVVPASNDLYIRFSGYLEEYSVVNMSYNTYHLGNCSNNELKCKDGRCLSLDFRCDGIKQCPEGTDEDLCPSSEVSEDEVPLYPSIQTEGYYNDATHQKFFVVMLLGGFGLVAIAISVLIFMAKRCKQTTAPQQLSQAVGELSDAQPTFPVNSCNCDNPPSYEDFIKSSDNYPPLLYTRANQRFVPNSNCMQCTTSFCTGARVRHYSADSFNVRSSDTGSDIFLNITGNDSHPTYPTPNGYNIEINRNLAFRATKRTIKRSCSLDSNLNDLISKDSCNLFLSVIHPVCAHMSNHHPLVQCHTLPPNFKMNSFKTTCSSGPRMNRPDILQYDSGVNFFKERCFTWSFVPHRSVGSEIVTIVKTRCFSDPYKGINVHCSLY